MFGNNPGSNETWKKIPEGSTGAELGVWKGDSSAKFFKRAKHIHLVDSWSPIAYEDSDEHGDYEAYLERYSKLVGSKNPKDFQKYYDKIYKNVVDRFKDKSITIHRMVTKEFFESFSEKLDWIYVDASHSYDGCYYDLTQSLNLIKDDGILLGDDYSDKKLGVKTAVNDFVKNHDVIFENFYMDQYLIRKV